MFEISLVPIVLNLKGILQCVWKNIYSWAQTLKFLIQWTCNGRWKSVSLLSEADASGFDLTLRITVPVYEVPWKISETIVISGNKGYTQKTLKHLFPSFLLFHLFPFLYEFFFFSFPSLPPFLLLNPHRTFSYWVLRYGGMVPIDSFRPINRIFLEFR